MPGIEAFLHGLSDPQWDLFVQVLQDLQDSASPERLENLRQFIITLNREIDTINRKRGAMERKASNIEAILPVLNQHLQKEPGLELELFRNLLVSWRAELKQEMSAVYPTGKKDKRDDTERKRDFLIQLQGIVGELGERISGIKKERGVEVK